MPAPISVRIARAIFVAASCLLGIAVALGFDGPTWIGAIAGTLFGAFLVLIDTLIKNFSIRGFSSATFGLLIGLGCAWLVTRIGIFDTPYLRGLKNYDALPANAKAYLKRLEEVVGVPVDIISTGPDREQTIIKTDPFE